VFLTPWPPAPLVPLAFQSWPPGAVGPASFSVWISECRESLWVLVSPCESLRVPVSPCESLWVPECPCESSWIRVSGSLTPGAVGPACFSVLTPRRRWSRQLVSVNQCEWVWIPWVPVSPCESLWAPESPCESLWVLASPCESLCVPVNPCESVFLPPWPPAPLVPLASLTPGAVGPACLSVWISVSECVCRESLWVLVSPCESLRVPVSTCESIN